jgi:GT2 family glycosyltransferase
MVKVSVIIPTMKGREEMLKRLLDSIPDEYEKIVVNDPGLLLAAKRNKGAKKAKGKYLLFIDDDNYLQDGAIQNMLLSFKDNIGIMAMTTCYSDKKMIIADGGSLRSMTTGFSSGIRTNCKVWYRPPFSLSNSIYEVSEAANAFMIRKEVFEDAGGFDEVNFPIDMDEADLCRRLKNMGYVIVYNPDAICYHNSITYSCIPDFRRPMNAYFMGRNRVLFQKKHIGKIRLTIYFLFFFPMFVGSYCLCLLLRRKPWMVVHFLKGVRDGITGRKENPYQ